MPEEAQSKKYIQAFPSDQNALDIFKGEWSSRLPDTIPLATGGQADLFEDHRISWAQSQGVDFQGKRILELGPLEAGHTWMMEQLGAEHILAIEGNTRCYLKCLIIKEIFGLNRSRFLNGDFDAYLKSTQDRYDICLASGVLYHSIAPHRLLQGVCKVCDQIILWTHYYDETILSQKEHILSRFSPPQTFEFEDERYRMHPFNYTDEIANNAFCGGLEPSSRWLEKATIEAILAQCGFTITAEGFDHPDHPNGPAVALIATKVSKT